MSTYMGDICVSTGKYTDQQGQQKNRYEKIGAWFQDDQGRVSIKVTMIPLLPPDPNGNSGFFASLFAKQDGGRQQQPPAQNRPPAQQGQQQPPAQQGWYDANNIYHQGKPPANGKTPYQDEVPF